MRHWRFQGFDSLSLMDGRPLASAPKQRDRDGGWLVAIAVPEDIAGKIVTAHSLSPQAGF
jgi:hypothetical protein